METFKEEATDIRRFGCVGDGKFDNWQVLQKALADGWTNLYIPGGYWRITRPLVVPASLTRGSTVRIAGPSNAYSIILCDLPDTYANRGALEYFANAEGFSWGIVLEHLQLQGSHRGGPARCHGIYLQQIAYPLFTDVAINRFDGAGLLIDKCQDGEFRNLNIQDCGRSAGDPADPAQTLYSALHLTNSVLPGDACNMLRFNALQCENNRVSPYISVRLGVGIGPIGIFFSQVHGEVRAAGQQGQCEFLRAEGGDFQCEGMALVGFKTGFVFTGYGVATFANCRSLCGIRHPTPNIVAGSLISNCPDVGNLYSNAVRPGFKVVNSAVGDVHLDYPGAANQRFSHCDLGRVAVNQQGGTGLGVYITHCTLASLTIDAATHGHYAFNVITGDLTCRGQNGDNHFVDNRVLGRTSIATGNCIYTPAARQAASPVALDPDWGSLEPIPDPPHRYSARETQKLTQLVRRLQVLLRAEIARRRDLEARLIAARLLEGPTAE
ncbi:MAG: hypothetical protein KME03_07030 [Aphanocapsa lilacina HA4352-LM1]|nr:hypothetical protein [Aphanocapsa lilacina HA4352-LM1]